MGRGRKSLGHFTLLSRFLIIYIVSSSSPSFTMTKEIDLLTEACFFDC